MILRVSSARIGIIGAMVPSGGSQAEVTIIFKRIEFDRRQGRQGNIDFEGIRRRARQWQREGTEEWAFNDRYNVRGVVDRGRAKRWESERRETSQRRPQPTEVSRAVRRQEDLLRVRRLCEREKIKGEGYGSSAQNWIGWCQSWGRWGEAARTYISSDIKSNIYYIT